MDERQALEHVKAKVQETEWPTGAGEKVMTCVISPGMPDNKLADQRFPLLLVTPGSAQIDPKQPGVMTATFDARLLVEVEGDETGEAPLMGAGRSGGEGSSQGRGLLEVQERLFATLLLRTEEDGFDIQLVAQSGVRPALVGDTRFMVFRDYAFSMWITTFPSEEA